MNACRTNVGNELVGEGSFNLVNSFLKSGVRFVVATNQSVNDQVAKDFITEFYKFLCKNQNVSLSLKDAIINIKYNYKTSHPYYWGNYVVYGI
jgi:CHAT domain-containing protein